MQRLTKAVRLRPYMIRTLRLLSGTLGFLFAASVAAQVTLSHSVKKVENFVNESGDVERQWVDASSVVRGDELRYTITFTNIGQVAVDAGYIVITNPIPASTEYLDGTAVGADTEIEFSTDGENFTSAALLMIEEDGLEVMARATDYVTIRWTFAPALEPGAMGHVAFSVRMK